MSLHAPLAASSPATATGAAVERRPAKDEPPHAQYAMTGDTIDDDDEADLLAELDAVENKMVRWDRVFSWKAWLRWKLVPYYIIGVVIAVLAALLFIYHKQITTWLRPAADWMKELPAGFLIPVAVMTIQSFPPLFGQEIVAVLCGLVWGLWKGFLIVCAGTFIGECANYVCFKYWFRSSAEKVERNDIAYACLAQAIRSGGFWLCLVVRLSILPGHMTTVVFSTCGMGFWEFALGAFFSLPKQLVTVYLGVALEQPNPDKKTKIGNYCVVTVTLLITVASLWWIWHKMKLARPTVVRERRRRQKLLANGGSDAIGKVDAVEMDGLTFGADRAERGWGASRQSVEWEVPSDRPGVTSLDTGYERPTLQTPSGPNGLYADPYFTANPSAAQPFGYPEPRLNDHAGRDLQSQQAVASASLNQRPATHGQATQHGLEPSDTSTYHSAHTSHGADGARPTLDRAATAASTGATSIAPSYRSKTDLADPAGQERTPAYSFVASSGRF